MVRVRAESAQAGIRHWLCSRARALGPVSSDVVRGSRGLIWVSASTSVIDENKEPPERKQTASSTMLFVGGQLFSHLFPCLDKLHTRVTPDIPSPP